MSYSNFSECYKKEDEEVIYSEFFDFTAAALSEVCLDVAIEPVLQPLSGESFHYATVNVEGEAHLDVSVQGLWGNHHKQRKYEQCVRDVEMGSFTPLIFSTFGGIGVAATTAYKKLASLLAAKRDHSYSTVVSWIRCSTSFSLLRSAVTCLRGARSHCGSPVTIGALDLAISEGQVLLSHACTLNCCLLFFHFIYLLCIIYI